MSQNTSDKLKLYIQFDNEGLNYGLSATHRNDFEKKETEKRNHQV